MKNTLILLLCSLVLLSCNDNEQKITDSNLQKSETTQNVNVKGDLKQPSQAGPNAAEIQIIHGGETIVDKKDLQASVSITKKGVLVELTENENKVTFGVKWKEPLNQKPFKGNFSKSPYGNDKMALMMGSVSQVGSENNSQNIPIAYEGTLTVTKLNENEVIVEVSGRGAIKELMSVEDKWQPITAKIVCKNPKISSVVDRESVYY